MKFRLFVAAVACCVSTAQVASATTTSLFTDTYFLETEDFFYFDNFWAGRSANATDASDPVPVERLSMTFDIMYFSPIETASAFRNAAVSFSITDLDLVLSGVDGLTMAQTLTEADIEEQSAFLRTRVGGLNRLQFEAELGDYELDVFIEDFGAFTSGETDASSFLQVDVDSLRPFDSPDYRSLGQNWTVQRLSSTSVPAPVPLPAGGWLLLSALTACGALARLRRA